MSQTIAPSTSSTARVPDGIGIIATLQKRVEGFVDELPFFRAWQPGNVPRATTDQFLITFDHLVGCFPPLIALAISRLDEKARVVLAQNLFEECGEGDASRTHHAIYRNFMRSVGLVCDGQADDYTCRWRSGLEEGIVGGDPSEVVGVITAGEVLAQPALSRIYAVLKPVYEQADVEYFTTHLELEANHVAELAELIAVQCTDANAAAGLMRGFERGLACWREWFQGLRSHAFA